MPSWLKLSSSSSPSVVDVYKRQVIACAILLKSCLVQAAEKRWRIHQAIIVCGRGRGLGEEFVLSKTAEDATIAEAPRSGHVQQTERDRRVALLRAIGKQFGPVEERVLRIQACLLYTSRCV